MFYGCASLSYLDDISVWNINNLNEISLMRYDCPLLNNSDKILNIFFQKNNILKVKDEIKRKEKEEKKRKEKEEKKRKEKKKK